MTHASTTIEESATGGLVNASNECTKISPISLIQFRGVDWAALDEGIDKQMERL